MFQARQLWSRLHRLYSELWIINNKCNIILWRMHIYINGPFAQVGNTEFLYICFTGKPILIYPCRHSDWIPKTSQYYCIIHPDTYISKNYIQHIKMDWNWDESIFLTGNSPYFEFFPLVPSLSALGCKNTSASRTALL